LLAALERLHADRSGAVALLCLAGLLIVFMTALVMYDAGTASREKMKVQMSADAASYSMASVKARSMNIIAYMNVVKRSLASMFEMYVGMMYAFRLEVDDTLSCLMKSTDTLSSWDHELQQWETTYKQWQQSCNGVASGDGDGIGDNDQVGNNNTGACGAPPARPGVPPLDECPGCHFEDRTHALSEADIEAINDQIKKLMGGMLGGIDTDAIFKLQRILASEQRCDQLEVFDAEAFGDWNSFARDADPYVLNDYFGDYGDVVTRFIRVNLQSLQKMQDDLAAYAPEWARMEAKQRGMSSGAREVISEKPGPDLPLENGMAFELCMGPGGFVLPVNESGPELKTEISANKLVHEHRSVPESGFKDDALANEGMHYMRTVGCSAAKHNINHDPGGLPSFLSMLSFFFGGNFADMFGKQYMAPYHATKDAIFDKIETNRTNELTSGAARKKFGYIHSDYNGSLKPDEYDGVSCGEAFSLAPDYDLWRASWGPRVAPVKECDDDLKDYWK